MKCFLLPMTRACEPNLGMEAHVIQLVIICDLYCHGHEGLKTLRCRCMLNVLFRSSLTSLFHSNHILTRSSWCVVASLSVGCEWRYHSSEA
jgi:hypothetical protein